MSGLSETAESIDESRRGTMPRREIFLLTVKGERARPGLTAALTVPAFAHARVRARARARGSPGRETREARPRCWLPDATRAAHHALRPPARPR